MTRNGVFGGIAISVALCAVGTACDGELGHEPGFGHDGDGSLAAMGRSLGDADDDEGLDGAFLFEEETFEGNGRTCRTCHTGSTGALSPQQVQAAFDEDPNGPLFRAIDSDGGLGASYDRLLEDATIRVTLPLPPGWTLVDDPTATEVTVLRGVPTTMNVPSLDDIFMADARFDTLEDQALGAINAHAEPGRAPTMEELEAIADFQQTGGFFSDVALRKWAKGLGPAPELPAGNTPSEIRGRRFFEADEDGWCAFCHSGPMLDETSGFMPFPPLPPGVRVFTAFVSEFNVAGYPVQTFEVDNGDGTTTIVQTPDPGRALITGELADLNLFRTPSLWGIKDTAPYFHDNSAATLGDLMDHYAIYFDLVGFPLTEQDLEDIEAYMKLL